MSFMTLSKARRHVLWPLAVHEAGHVLAARRLAVPVSAATIVADCDSCGHVTHAKANTYSEIMITLTGPRAERRVDPVGTESDPALAAEEAEIWGLLPVYAADTGLRLDDDRDGDAERHPQLRELFNAFVREVERMLTEEWAAIENIALALINRKTLSARMIAWADAA